MDEPDSSRTAFWTKRWDAGKTPWDLGHVPPALVQFLSRPTLQTQVLVPGCGTGYELRAFREVGHEVTGIEFCATAVAHAKEALGPLGDRVIHGNFFKHDFGTNRYGFVYERGFLCSLPPDRWPDYVSRMASLILPKGRLVGLFLYGEEPEPPPYPLTPATAAALLGGKFRLLTDERATGDTVPVYQGMEHWQEWERFPD